MVAMRAARVPALLGLLLLGTGGVAAPSAGAAVRDLRITQDGVSPDRLQAGPGDAVRFVNADTFLHRVVDDGGDWDFDSGDILPGRTYTVRVPPSGTNAYRGEGLDRFTGTVVVRAAGAAPPVTAAQAGPPLDAGPGGSAATDPPPRLSSPVTARRFGLPLVLATVLVVGVLSLLVRLLMAETPTRPGSPPPRHLRLRHERALLSDQASRIGAAGSRPPPSHAR